MNPEEATIDLAECENKNVSGKRIVKSTGLSHVIEDNNENTPKKLRNVLLDEEDERLVLNVGGVRHETHVSTLKNIPNTRLARLADAHAKACVKKGEYFFDRHPAVFNSVIDFYRTGELHVPLEVCGAVVKRELNFWQVNEMGIKACCWRHYRSYIENQRILDSFNISLIREEVHVDLSHLEGWKKFQMKGWLILEHPRTSRMAMVYGIVSLMFVVTSIMGFCLESLPGLRPKQENNTQICDGVAQDTVYLGEAHVGLYYLDLICTIFFTMELVIRFIFAPEKLKFIKSVLNLIDLLALVPLYVQVLFQNSEDAACYPNERFVLEVMFILRIIRMFRIFHLVKHYQALKILVYALKASVQELMMLAIFLFIGMLIFASMIYYAERKSPAEPSERFNTIPKGFWWAIITMTTVGYGDIYPTSAIGCLIGGACAVSGVLLVALTIPVISNNFTLFYTHVRSRTSGVSADDKVHNSSSSSQERTGSFRFKRSKRMVFEEANPSKTSAVVETCMNGKTTISRLAKKYSPANKFNESSSMTDIILKLDETEPILCRNRSIKAYSDDGVTYQRSDTNL